MSQGKCVIQVNGAELEARPGQMLIEVTDAAGIYVPRFCYHSKLTVAANCRMCLVEVENAPKPLPACATPVTPGMKVHTKSLKAIGAQKATMEFLLINHPLDCPICDQGGECELQDLAMGFGRDVSRYAERKRVVKDKDIGPLVSTDMTRCIHCTRCVRFTEEIAGVQELGTIGRSDRMEISTYIERAVTHELSGNIIDLCPVGALNSKPFRFTARAWEMSEHATVAGHDCLGSHVFAHVLDGRVKRVVPQACEAINETWLSDRDRFGYEGMYAADRLEQPMLRDEDGWHPVTWEQAFEAVAQGLRGAGSDVGALVSPSATVEEGYLLTRLLDHLGSPNIDHRLRRRDFRGQDADPVFPSLGIDIAGVESLEQILVVGSNLRREVPLLAHRVRKAALRGAGVHFVNPARFSYLFPAAGYYEGAPGDFWQELDPLVQAAGGKGTDTRTAPGDPHRELVGKLRGATRKAILLGHLGLRHPELSKIEFLAGELARLTGSPLGHVSEGANAAGLALAGVLPHRHAGGRMRPTPGATAADMVASPPRVLLLCGVEPDLDCAEGAQLMNPARKPELVIALSPFMGESLRRLAHVVLPVATPMETSGTFVNVEGRWQSFDAVAPPLGEARPAWKVLRVLADWLDVPACDYATSEAIRDDLRALLDAARSDSPTAAPAAPGGPAGQTDVTLADLDVPMYQVDALVRRATALQLTGEARAALLPGADRRRA